MATASPGGGVVDSLDSPPPAAALVVLSFSSVPSLFSWTPLSSFSFLFFSVLGHRFDVAVHVYGCCGMESKRPLDGFLFGQRFLKFDGFLFVFGQRFFNSMVSYL